MGHARSAAAISCILFHALVLVCAGLGALIAASGALHPRATTNPRLARRTETAPASATRVTPGWAPAGLALPCWLVSSCFGSATSRHLLRLSTRRLYPLRRQVIKSEHPPSHVACHSGMGRTRTSRTSCRFSRPAPISSLFHSMS
jgi:hypothetical protein